MLKLLIIWSKQVFTNDIGPWQFFDTSRCAISTTRFFAIAQFVKQFNSFTSQKQVCGHDDHIAAVCGMFKYSLDAWPPIHVALAG